MGTKLSHIGIDFGAKMSGNTAIAFLQDGILQIRQTPPKSDADAWLLNSIEGLAPDFVFIDAPLSLPGVYKQLPGETDYFYRECDRQLSAMSPMFIGGLTARAVQLSHRFSNQGIRFFETYPKQMARLVSGDLKQIYKTNEGFIPFTKFLEALTGQSLQAIPTNNWHQVDAVLAWWAGCRFFNGEAITYGNPLEGAIIV